jgi:hypothetical protein
VKEINESSRSWPYTPNVLASIGVFYENASFFAFGIGNAVINFDTSVNNDDIVVIVGNLF